MFGWKKGEDTIQGRVAGFQARRERPLVVDHRPPAPPVPPAAPEPLAAPLDAPAILAARDAAPPTPEPHTAESVRPLVQAAVDAVLTPDMVPQRTRADLALAIDEAARAALSEHGIALPVLPQRNLVTLLLNDLLRRAEPAKPLPKAPEDAARTTMVVANRASIDEAAPRIYPIVMQRIDTEVAMRLNREELARQLAGLVAEILTEERIQLNQLEQRDLVTVLLNDMLGLGPLEPLLADDGVTDIMVNGPKQVYVERRGKLELTGIAFRDNAHVMAVATRIVTTVGRRVDESSPLCDARLPDGSRVNIIIPPLAIDGPSISIRKFSKKTIDLDVMSRQGNCSAAMATVLKIAARCRLNILVSGGTGSGKTTLLNALSQMIDPGERIVTIEDAAELQLQQPHVVRLETRPANLEGRGEISIRDLVKNSLRMRPDRIILGEIRSAEALDLLQAMNTGHDGSLGTIHANRPREALTRLENMVAMSGVNLPTKAVRTQIAAAVHMIVQVSRMRDGMRRITNIMEVVGMEGEVVTTQELFSYEFEGEGADGKLKGSFRSSGLRPHFMPKAEYYGLDRMLTEALS